MYVHDKSSFHDNGTKTRWIVNINVKLPNNLKVLLWNGFQQYQ